MYSCTRSQKLEISSVLRVKRSVYTQQCLAVYTTVASKNIGVQRVKTPVKTRLGALHTASRAERVRMEADLL